jgi:tetratricopeptide (TPR) repeat protein
MKAPATGDAGHDSGLDLLLGVAAKKLIHNDDPGALVAWMIEAAPALMPSLFARTVDPAPAVRVLARGIYGITPLPQHGYVAQPLPKPDGDEPCFCGSGRRFRQCCEAIDSAMRFPEVNMLRYVLDAAPRGAYAGLPETRVNIDAVIDTARQWSEEGRERDLVILLEPWFAGEGPLRGGLDFMFDLLMDAYLHLGKPRKRKLLIETALARGDRNLRGTAWQRRAVMAADQGQHDQALEAFREAQRLNPDDLALTHLEISLLIGAGRMGQARERARFWLARVQRVENCPPLLLDLLRRTAEDPAAAILDIEERRVPSLTQLRSLMRKLPAPEVQHDLELNAEGSGFLRPRPALAKAEAKWRSHFAQAKPMLAMLGEANSITFFRGEKWLPLLQREPLLWQSFDVLDDLAMAVHGLGLLGANDVVMVPLLDRAVALLRLHVDAAGARRLPWGFLENRPALRSVAARVHAALEADDRDTALPLAEWLVRELNPNDNHGLRGPLMRMYVQAGRYDDAIALAQCCPEDFTELALTHVLALYCAGHADAAAAALRQAAAGHRRMVTMLLAETVKEPKAGGLGITVGGAEEAWLYRKDHRELWREKGALAWAAEVLARPTRQPRR